MARKMVSTAKAHHDRVHEDATRTKSIRLPSTMERLLDSFQPLGPSGSWL